MLRALGSLIFYSRFFTRFSRVGLLRRQRDWHPYPERLDGQTWLIHDTHGITYRNDRAQLLRAPLNGVSVTPLQPLLFDNASSYIDRIANIQRIRP